VGLNPDSAHYLGTAKSLLAGKGYVTFDGTLYALYPPLFSTLLAFFGLWTDLFTAARLINALCFGALVFMSGRLFFKTFSSKGLALGATLSILFSPQLLDISSKALSDALFVVLSFLCMDVLSRAVDTGRPAGEKRLFFVIACLVASLACLQRYAGVVLIGVVVFAFVFFRRDIPFRSRLLVSCFSGMLMGLPLLSWIVRNHCLTGAPVGSWGSHPETVQSLFIAYADPFTNWFFPSVVPLAIRSLLVFAGAWVVLAKVRLREPVWILFITALSAFMIFSAMKVDLTYYGRFEDRYLLPLYAPVIFLIFLGVDLFPKTTKKRAALVAALCVAWCFFCFYRVCKNVAFYQINGVAVYSREAFSDRFNIR
jgi:4-amino-4-deoxy-L-arabinose transferase-like glycosyltransferase